MRDIANWVCRLSLQFAIGVSALQAQEVPRPAKVEAVTSDMVSRIWTFPAIVLPSREVSLSFRISGQVIELPVRAALPVAEGDTIAKLDPRDFEARVRQLESQRDQAVAQLEALRSGAREEEVRALEAALESARAQAERASADTERTRQLVQRNIASRVMLEQAETQLRVSEAALRAQEEQLAIAIAGGRVEEIEAAEAGLRGLESQLETARDTLSDVTLAAPFDGVVARRSIDNFTLVQAGQEIVLLQNISTLHLAFDVPAAQVQAIGRVAEELSVTVSFSGSDTEYPAELVEYSIQADAETQTYRGRVAVDAPDDTIVFPGMVGRVLVRPSGHGAPVLKVPVSAIGAGLDGEPFVWVVGESGKVAKRSVMTGSVTGSRVEILSGLDADETVIAAGVSRLREGMTVRPIERVGD